VRKHVFAQGEQSKEAAGKPRTGWCGASHSTHRSSPCPATDAVLASTHGYVVDVAPFVRLFGHTQCHECLPTTAKLARQGSACVGTTSKPWHAPVSTFHRSAHRPSASRHQQRNCISLLSHCNTLTVLRQSSVCVVVALDGCHAMSLTCAQSPQNSCRRVEPGTRPPSLGVPWSAVVGVSAIVNQLWPALRPAVWLALKGRGSCSLCEPWQILCGCSCTTPRTRATAVTHLR